MPARPERRKEFVLKNQFPAIVVHPDPTPTIEVASEIPDSVRRAFLEAKRAHAAGLDIASLLAARTAMLRMQREQKCEGIDDLAGKGVITRFLAQQAHEIRLWGNLFAHEDPAADILSAHDVTQLLGFLELLFDTVYVQPAKLNELKDKRAGQKP
jgi:hypothetical protein